MIRDTVDISAPPEAVWSWIADPHEHGAWNPKVTLVEGRGSGTLRQGDRYQIHYVMSGKAHRCDAMVMRCEQPELLEIRLDPADEPRMGVFTERYELEPTGEGTRLTQTIDLSQSGIPRWARWLIRFINRTGTPQGEPYLVTLKRLVEDR